MDTIRPAHVEIFGTMRTKFFSITGSGLGRFVILAATIPFARIVGIELSPVLVEKARTNVYLQKVASL